MSVKGRKDHTCCGKDVMRMGPFLRGGAVRAAKTKSAFYNYMLRCVYRRKVRNLRRRGLGSVLAFTGTTTSIVAAEGNTLHMVPAERRVRGLLVRQTTRWYILGGD